MKDMTTKQTEDFTLRGAPRGIGWLLAISQV